MLFLIFIFNVALGMDTCAICLDDVPFNDDRSVVTNCQHKFHETCLHDLFSRRVVCPICRGIITSVFRWGDIDNQRNIINELRPAMNMQMAVVNVQNNGHAANLGNVPVVNVQNNGPVLNLGNVPIVNMPNNFQQPLLANGLHAPENERRCCDFCKPIYVISADIAYLFIFALSLLRTETHKMFHGHYSIFTTTGPSLGEFQGFDIYLFPILSLISVLILHINYPFKILGDLQMGFLGYSIYHFLLLSFNFVGYSGDLALIILFDNWLIFWALLSAAIFYPWCCRS